MMKFSHERADQSVGCRAERDVPETSATASPFRPNSATPSDCPASRQRGSQTMPHGPLQSLQ
jgi:hypothetical protein